MICKGQEIVLTDRQEIFDTTSIFQDTGYSFFYEKWGVKKILARWVRRVSSVDSFCDETGSHLDCFNGEKYGIITYRIH